MGFKLSLMLTYLRFMPKGAARMATIGVIVFCIIFHLTFLIIQINLCTPVSHNLMQTELVLLTMFRLLCSGTENSQEPAYLQYLSIPPHHP